MAPERSHGRAAALIFLLSFLTFLPTLRVGFMLDDQFLVPRLRPAWTWSNVRQDFTSNVHDDPQTYLYRPLQKMMVRLQHHVAGGRPIGYHLVSLVFHAGNAVLVYALALGLGASPLAAAFAGTAYGVHPLIVDDLLAATGGEAMAIFFLLSALVFLRRAPDRYAYTMGGVLYGLAMLAKESAVVLPFLLALTFWTERRPLRDYRWILPLVLLWLPYGVLRAHAVGSATDLSAEPLARFFLTRFPGVAWEGLRRILWPADLESWPPLPSLSPFWAVHLVVLAGAGVFSATRRSRWGGFALGWFLINLAPRVPAMLIGQSLFDKWISCASMGLLLGLGVGCSAFLSRASGAVKKAGALLAILVLSGWAWCSSWNIVRRGSDEKNYRWAMRREFRDFAAYRLSVILLRSGRADEALPWLEKLVERDTENLDYANTLALARWHSGDTSRAIASLQNLVAEHPAYAPARENLAQMLLRTTGH